MGGGGEENSTSPKFSSYRKPMFPKNFLCVAASVPDVVPKDFQKVIIGVREKGGRILGKLAFLQFLVSPSAKTAQDTRLILTACRRECDGLQMLLK